MSQSITALLQSLASCPPGPLTDEWSTKLRSAVGHRNYRVVARGAEIVADRKAVGFRDSLSAAYTRFLKNPLKSDPGCQAKTKLLDALRVIGHEDTEFFLTAIKYCQIEPVYGGSVDTAAELRGLAALALVQVGCPQLMPELVELLVDKEPAARAAAARAIAAAGRPESESVLRLKVHFGDERPEILGECFSGLMAIDADRWLPLVGEFVEHGTENVRNEAAIALGESRHPQALDLLRQRFESVPEIEERRALALAIALSRGSESEDFLISQITSASPETSVAAILALRHARDPAEIRDRVREAVNRCQDRYVARTFAEEFS